MKNNNCLILLRALALVLLLVPFSSQSCLAKTLFESSLSKFEAKAEKVTPDDYTFVVLGDSRDGEKVFKKVLALAKSFHPLFILHGGDYSRGGSEKETERFLRLVKEMVPEIPFFVVMGNHENREVFAREIAPFNFTLQSKRLGLTLISVDDSGKALKAPELDYLSSRLASAGRSSFVAMHVPPKTARWNWHTFTEGADRLREMLSASRVKGIFFPHVHLFSRAEYGGVPAFITGGGGAPLHKHRFPGDPVYHILVVRVKNGEPRYTMVPLPR